MPPHRHPSIDPTDPSTWPDACPDCGVKLWKKRQCMGHKVDDETGARSHCGKYAMKGQTLCREMGGAAPQNRAAAERRIEAAVARRATATYGLPIDIDPLDALLGELARTAGHVAWLGQLVASLEHHDDPKPTVLGDGGDRDPDEPHASRSGLKQYTRTEKFTVEQESVWVRMYRDERKHLASVAGALLKAGVDERRVKLAERQGELLAKAFRAFATALGLDPGEERVRTAMRASLMLVQGAA